MLVLWNPVLDLRHSWSPIYRGSGRTSVQIGWPCCAIAAILQVDREFALGRVLFEEFAHYRPAEAFIAIRVPALVIHGDKCSYLSNAIARDAAARHLARSFHMVLDSDHGFDSREREDEAIRVTVDWLLDRAAASA